MYSVNLELKGGGGTYKGEGETLIEAFSNVHPDGIIKTLGILTASHGNRKVTKVLNATRLNRMFCPTGSKELKLLAAISFSKFLNSSL